jgi:hypothetical protein
MPTLNKFRLLKNSEALRKIKQLSIFTENYYTLYMYQRARRIGNETDFKTLYNGIRSGIALVSKHLAKNDLFKVSCYLSAIEQGVVELGKMINYEI